MSNMEISRIYSKNEYIQYNRTDKQFIDEKKSEEPIVLEKEDSLSPYNKSLAGFDRKLEYSIHPETKTVMVKVINTEDNSVVREVPPEKMLDLIAKIWNITGVTVDIKL